MRSQWLLLSVLLACPAPGRADEGHQHGPDGRHIAPTPTEGGGAVQVLSHHDLRITDTGGRVVEGARVESLIHRRGSPKAIIHRETNVFEREHGVYGSHLTYREPGEYVLVEEVTLPAGRSERLEFPVWVPGPAGAAGGDRGPTWPWLVGGGVLLAGGAFFLGRRVGRRAAAGLGALLACASALLPARAEEAGHQHGPDGRHVTPSAAAGPDTPPLRAYLGPAGELAAEQVRNGYRFRLTIENEELRPDPDLVLLDAEGARAIGLETAAAERSAGAGGLVATGAVRPNPNGLVTVNAQVGGRLIRLAVLPGEAVRRGDVLAELEAPEVAAAQSEVLKARAEQRRAEAARLAALAAEREALAEVAAARAESDQAEAEAGGSRAEVEHARGELEEARSRVEGARQHLDRQRRFAAAGGFSQGPLQNARQALGAGEAEVQDSTAAARAADAELRRLEQGLRDGVTARREVDAAAAVAERARGRQSAAEARLPALRAAVEREERIAREDIRDAREVQAAEAALRQAEAAARTAEAALAREQQVVTAATALVRARGQRHAAAQARVGHAAAGVREADAAVRAARSAVAESLGLLATLGGRPGAGSRVTVTAPIGGEVHARPVTAGQVVDAGATLCVLANSSSVWVEADVYEQDLERVRVGQEVRITADALPLLSLVGTVSHIEHEVHADSRTVRVRAAVPNPGGRLRPNMFVRVVIGAAGSGTAIPAAAVQHAGADPVVFVVEGDGVYRRRRVRVGPALGARVLILAGLQPGERVVTLGAYQLLARSGR